MIRTYQPTNRHALNSDSAFCAVGLDLGQWSGARAGEALLLARQIRAVTECHESATQNVRKRSRAKFETVRIARAEVSDPSKGGRDMRSFFELGGTGLAVGVSLFSFASTPAAAYFDTGNEVDERCIAPDKTSKRQICLATASAYLDMMRALGYSCTSDNLTRRQVADVFVKFLRENPESRQKSGPSLAIEAFSKGFGCKEL
jgi:Rap1a immunity proteins